MKSHQEYSDLVAHAEKTVAAVKDPDLKRIIRASACPTYCFFHFGSSILQRAVKVHFPEPLPKMDFGITKKVIVSISGGAVAIWVGICFGAISGMARLADHAARSRI